MCLLMMVKAPSSGPEFPVSSTSDLKGAPMAASSLCAVHASPVTFHRELHRELLLRTLSRKPEGSPWRLMYPVPTDTQCFTHS